MNENPAEVHAEKNPIVTHQRYDYFLIWGHGLQYRDQIIRLIENQSCFEIKKIIFHEPSSIRKFVNTVYSYDYAPVFHLKSKTRYLLKTPRKALFIFVKNNNPEEAWFGTGSFRHYECLQVKRLKEEIRDKYNPYDGEKRSENHVIHASDNQGQAEAILSYLGYNRGIQEIEVRKGMIPYPYHLGVIRHVSISRIAMEKLYAWIVTPRGMKALRIFETPHYQTLHSGSDAYKNYLDSYLGYQLKDYYTPEKFFRLRDSFREFHEYGTYILVEQYKDDSYLILDGVHRAAILADRGDTGLLVAKVES